MIKRLAAILNKNEYQVSVEGHSDTVPIQTRQFASNWELSSSRATSVLRELVRDGVSAGRLRAVGYAETRPIESNETPAGRAANRRVELIMDITQPPKAAGARAGQVLSGGGRRPRRRPRTALSWRPALRQEPPSMSHLLLIVEPVGQRAERTPEQGREAYGAMLRYAESLNERGLLQRAESLKSDAEGVRLRVRDGERSVVDGPSPRPRK